MARVKTEPKFRTKKNEEEAKFVTENYGKMSAKEIAEQLGVTKTKVKSIVYCNGIEANGKESRYRSREDRAYLTKWQGYRNGAYQRDYEFELTIEEFKFLTKRNCYYCGDQPMKVTPYKHKKGLPTGEILFNGIDRIDNSMGYVAGNCVPCCGTCNEMKMARTEEKFLEKVAKIYNIHCKKEE